MANFMVWILWAGAVFLLVAITTLLFGMVFYPNELKPMIRALLPKRKR